MNSPRQEKFLEIADRYKEVIARVCSVYASAAAPFADLYQEVMVNLWLGLESWRGEAKMSTWIYRLAINTCITWQRHNRRHSATVAIDDVFEFPDISEDKTGAIQELYALINRLDSFDKALITLWLDEKPYEEIAQVLGISKTNVATRLSRIRAKLAAFSKTQ